jgi:4-hydroxy-tetrahydrodipicolinate reductase
MSSKTPIVMFGAAGRMGRMILSLAAETASPYEIAGAVDFAAHPLIGHPLSEIIPGAPAGLALQAAPPANPPAGTVAIHFSSPEATLEHLDWSLAQGVPALIGTTGMKAEQRAAMEAAGDRVAVLITPNTSLGVNVLFWLTEQATRLLGPGYDIEIVEMHHHHKKDAPSGTARGLAEAALRARAGDYDRDVRHGRSGLVGERTRQEIGMHALRGGDVVGDHTVIFATPGERIELGHRASSRETFARGALQAAAWLSGRPAGRYSMKDVLGL